MELLEDESPAHLIRSAWRFFPAWVNYTVIGLILLGLVVFGVQQIVFQADNQNIKHTQQTQKSQNQIIQGSDNVQQGYVQAITTDVASVDNNLIEATGAPNRAMLISGAVGYANAACQEAALLTGSYKISPEMQGWITANCSGGALRVDSPIRNGKGN